MTGDCAHNNVTVERCRIRLVRYEPINTLKLKNNKMCGFTQKQMSSLQIGAKSRSLVKILSFFGGEKLHTLLSSQWITVEKHVECLRYDLCVSLRTWRIFYNSAAVFASH